MQKFRFAVHDSLRVRLAKEAGEARAKASELPPCAEREALLEKARQADTAAHIDEWINSSGLRPPR